jgi:hypothetical protein
MSPPRLNEGVCVSVSSISARQKSLLVSGEIKNSSSSVKRRLRWMRNWLASPIASNFERFLCVVIFAALVVVRQPQIVLQGRFWAEEGNVFFVHAWTMPWYQALFQPYSGYLNLIANLGGLLARNLAPLSAAPYVSTGLALLIQCIPAILIVTSRDEWLQRRLVIGAALLIIAWNVFSWEVSLTSIASQYYLALAAAIILALEPRSGAVGAFQLLVLFITTLSAPASWVLPPLFAIRAVIDRSRLRALQTAVLLSGAVLQVAFFFGDSGGRHIGLSPTLFGAIVLAKHVITPILNTRWGQGVVNSYVHAFSEAGGPVWPLGIVIILVAIIFASAVRLLDKVPLWFFCAGVAIAGISYFGALSPKLNLVHTLWGARYAMAPQVLFDLSLLSWCSLHRGRVRFWTGCAVAWLIVMSLWDFGRAQEGPLWRPEVVKWQENSSYALQIWPTGWTMHLPSK